MMATRQQRRRLKRAALTLLELVVVLAVLAVLAAVLVPMFSSSIDSSRRQVTLNTMRTLQGIVSNRYALDMRGQLSTSSSPAVAIGLPGPDPTLFASRTQVPQLEFLFINPSTSGTTATFDPVSGRGWRGPYLMSGTGKYPGLHVDTASTRGFTTEFGVTDDDAPLDGWGNPIVVVTVSHQGYIPTADPFTDTTILGYLVSAGPDEDLQTAADNIYLPLR